jgi:hypothetical protein
MLVCLSACGGGANPDREALKSVPPDQILNGEKFVVLSASDALNFKDGTLTGSGVLRFAQDLGAVESNFNYALFFKLADNGELTLVSHADPSLETGVSVTFKRLGNQLKVTATALDTADDWTSFFKSIDASADIKIAVDVHNSEALTHFILWNDSNKRKLIDTAEDVNGGPGKGRGQNWGLRLINAELLSVVKSDARHEH